MIIDDDVAEWPSVVAATIKFAAGDDCAVEIVRPKGDPDEGAIGLNRGLRSRKSITLPTIMRGR